MLFHNKVRGLIARGGKFPEVLPSGKFQETVLSGNFSGKFSLTVTYQQISVVQQMQP